MSSLTHPSLMHSFKKEKAEEQKRIEKLKAELRGREYTYDSNGEVIIIQPVDPDKLPSQKYVSEKCV